MIAQTLPQFQPRGLVYNNDHLVFKNTYDSDENFDKFSGKENN